MSAAGDSPAEMPSVPPQRGRRFLDETAAEELLAGLSVPPDAPPGQQALARVLQAAARPATERELSGEAAAVARLVLAIRVPPRSHAARAAGLAAGAVTAAVIAVSGTAAAGALPAPVQQVAHTAFGAPAPHHGGVHLPVTRQPENHGHPDGAAKPCGKGAGPQAKRPKARQPKAPSPLKATATPPSKPKGQPKAAQKAKGQPSGPEPGQYPAVSRQCPPPPGLMANRAK